MRKVGFIGVGPEQGTYVPIEDAFEYAVERLKNGSKEEKEEFISWWYSGNFCKEES